MIIKERKIRDRKNTLGMNEQNPRASKRFYFEILIKWLDNAMIREK